jgi:hypothetical protein
MEMTLFFILFFLFGYVVISFSINELRLSSTLNFNFSLNIILALIYKKLNFISKLISTLKKKRGFLTLFKKFFGLPGT